MSGHQQNTQTQTSETEDTLAGVNQTTLVTNEAEEFHIEFNDKIRLYFLRYGLFAKHNKDEHLISPDSKEDQEESLVLPTLEVAPPSLEHFDVGRTALNSGYLYLFDEEDKDLFYEYELHVDGRAQTIYEPVYEAGQRTNNGNLEDNRISSGEFETKKEFVKDQILWVGYSQVQWTGKYHRKMLDAGPDERKKKGLVRVNCAGFPDGFGQEHVLQQSQVRATFREDQKASDTWCDNILNQINVYENKVKPDIKRDMFIVLPDPIGCAIDVAFATNTEVIQLRANLEGMKYAISPETVYQAMQTDSNEYARGREDQEAMFMLALSSYQMVYNDSDNVGRYDGGDLNPTFWEQISAGIAAGATPMPQETYEVINDQVGIDKNKLVSALGVEERKEHRALINELRTDLKKFLESDYYKKAYQIHNGNDVMAFTVGSYSIYQLFNVLYLNPHDIDKSLDLKDEYEEDPLITDSFITYIDTYKGTSLFELLEQEIDITEEIINQHPSISKIFFQVAEYNISLRVQKISSMLESFEDIRKSLDRLNISGRSFIQYQNSGIPSGNLTPQLSIMGQNFQQRPSGLIVRSNQLLSGNGTPIQSPPMSRINIPNTDNFNINGITFSRNNLKGLLIVIDLYNTLFIISNWYQNPNRRDAIDFFRSAATIGDAIMDYRAAVKGVDLSKNTLNRLFKVASGGLSMGLSVYDALISTAARDRDATIAHSIAALSSAIALGAVVIGSGGVALLFTIIAFGFTFLASLLRDTPLESFFKNFAFGDTTSFDQNGMLAWEYNAAFYPLREVYSNLSRSGHSRFEELKSFTDDLGALTDMVTQTKVTIVSNRVVNQGFGSGRSYSDQFTATIEVNNIIDGISENLDLKVIYRSGIWRVENPDLNVQYFQPMRLGSTDRITKVRVNFNISGDFLEHHSNVYGDSFGIWFLFRFKIDSLNSFPSKRSDGKNYYYKVSYSLLSDNDSGKTREADIIALEDI
ncbi:toxin VasX [uncultured Aquimarina sp.]|uniref:toxin VasX n=1 Tax=uncultured Aquimarina sp. TaxID=575652 RepID=UPI00262BC1F3|nr:toxin VasX [uncultured Aquimarina sp.]